MQEKSKRLTLSDEQIDRNMTAEECLASIGPRLRRHLRGVLRNREDEDDLFQQISLELVRQWPKFKWECPPYNWALGISWNIRKKYYRIMRRDQALGIRRYPTDVVEQAAAPDPGSRHWKLALLDQLMEQLPHSDREIVLLYRGDRMTFAEIAKTLKKSVEAVAKKFQRAKKKLRQLRRKVVPSEK